MENDIDKLVRDMDSLGIKDELILHFMNNFYNDPISFRFSEEREYQACLDYNDNYYNKIKEASLSHNICRSVENRVLYTEPYRFAGMRDTVYSKITYSNFQLEVIFSDDSVISLINIDEYAFSFRVINNTFNNSNNSRFINDEVIISRDLSYEIDKILNNNETMIEGFLKSIELIFNIYVGSHSWIKQRILY